jgi:pimeloyl-ACP methyl ester carboxylesterase
MHKQLEEIEVDTFLIEGDKDLLFPFQNSIKNAKKHLHQLKETKVFENVGHGIETYGKALTYIGDKIKNYN